MKQVVQRRMKQLKMTPYALAKAVKSQMTKQTVYNFCRGKAELNTRSLGYLLEALELEIRPKARKR